MDRKSAKEYVNKIEPTFLTPAPKRVSGNITYICPSCGKGSYGDYKGISPYTKNGKIKYHCFDCGLDEDIVGLWKIDRGIDDNAEAFSSLYSYYGLTVDGETQTGQYQNNSKSEQYTHNNIHINAYTPEEEKPEVDYTDFFLQANKDLEKTDYHRGISLDTLNRFKVGYVEEWVHPKATTPIPSPRLIIPTSRYSYLARDTRANLTEKQKDFSKPKVGKVRLFNSSVLWKAQKPIFVVEGEIDALSIIDVGGEALGLGSIAYKKMLPQLIKNKGQKPVQPLILALDNDKDSEENSGQEAEADLAKMLEEEGISYYRKNIYPDGKDANEELMENREKFTETIKKAEVEVMEAEAEKKANDTESEIEKSKEEEKEAYLKTSTANYIQGFLDKIKDSVNTPCIPTGFQKLDNILDGGLYEGLYIIGAISSLGKTSLILSIADQIAQSGKQVLFFSLEMARTELMAKSISRLTLLDVIQNNGNMRDAKTVRGITVGKRYENYSKTEQELIQRSVIAYSKYADNIFIHEGIGDIGANDIRTAVARHLSLTGRKAVIMVDYLQILAPAEVRATDKQNMDKAVLELKRISRDFKVPVIAVSSLNRMSYNNEVTMESYKESGAIEYSSDVLLGLQLKGAGSKDFNANEAKTKNPREIELRVLKNRNGATGGVVELEYYPMFNYFKEA